MENNPLINTKNPVVLAERGRKEKPKSADMELNMTAMIDVLFMLILFFLIGARFVKPEGSMASKMPEVGESTGVQPVVPPLTIGVLENGVSAASITVNQQPVAMDSLYRTLRDKAKEAGFSLGSDVIIKPTPMASWNDVMKVYNTALRVGFTQVKWSQN